MAEPFKTRSFVIRDICKETEWYYFNVHKSYTIRVEVLGIFWRELRVVNRVFDVALLVIIRRKTFFFSEKEKSDIYQYPY